MLDTASSEREKTRSELPFVTATVNYSADIPRARAYVVTPEKNYRPLVPKDRRMIITGLGDRMAPPEHAVNLWEHWDHCAMHWFPGNHVLHVSQLDYLRRMTPFLREFMF